YDEVLQSEASLADMIGAMAQSSDGSFRARTVLEELADDPAAAGFDVELASLFDFGDAGRFQLGDPPKGLSLQLEAVQMLTVGALAANHDRQLELDLGGDVPGLASTRVWLTVGERPQSTTWFSLADESHTYVSTAQLRLFIEAAVETGGLLSDKLVRLPIYIELASAKAQVKDVICEHRQRKVKRVDIDVHPAILDLRIADLPRGLESLGDSQDFELAKLMDTGLIRVSGYARATLASQEPETLRFHASQIGQDPKTVETTDALQGALPSMVETLELNVDVGGFIIGSPDIVNELVADALQTAAEPVDMIVHGFTDLLGVSLGEADVWVHDAQCNRAVLVQ
ncbi:MAG: hypothetical protein WA989_17360, partial [Henriciella sp.]